MGGVYAKQSIQYESPFSGRKTLKLQAFREILNLKSIKREIGKQTTGSRLV